MKKIISFIIMSLMLLSNTYANDDFKGVWVATVYNLDYPTNPTTDLNKLKSEAVAILDNIQRLGFNAVFLQVRPSADSFYKSSLFPWSNYLTGTNGVAPKDNFDPLSFWITEAHKRGIELHAWINPYRITKNGDSEYNLISENSPAKLYPEYVVKYSDGNCYFNPGIPEVRKLVIDGVLEIINNYDVDGIHMDDYFYPGASFDDSEAYKKYKGSFTNIEDWRRNNVNLLVKELGEKIHSIDKNISYGISPAGIWANAKNNSLGSNTNGSESYYLHYADTRKWALENWVDYIAPQIYWENGNKAADYENLINWWSNTLKNSNTKLYVGLADYRVEGAGKNSVWYNGKEIKKQMNQNLNNNIIDGEIHYRYSSIISNTNLFNAIKEQYSDKEITVWINNKKLLFDTKPEIQNGRTLVPIRVIFEELGATVSWNNNKITAKKGDVIVQLEIGSNIMYINNKKVKLDVPPAIKKNRTLVPLRAISEAFNNRVTWNGIYKTIEIN